MSLTVSSFTGPLISSLGIVGHFFSFKRFNSTIVIVGTIAQEWLSRFPNSNPGLNKLVGVFRSFQTIYHNEIFSAIDCIEDNEISDQTRVNDNVDNITKQINWKIVVLKICEGFIGLNNLIISNKNYNLINLSRFSTILGKIPVFRLINRMDVMTNLVVGSFSYSLLSAIYNSNKMLTCKEEKGKKLFKYSLYQSLVGITYYSFIFFGSKNNNFGQPTMIRVAVVAKEFFSVVFDYMKTK